jgi:outer membrane biosynthesis protein TonB
MELAAPRTASRYASFLLVSLLLHLSLMPLGLLLLRETALRSRVRQKTNPASITLSLVENEPLQRKSFIPTEPWQPPSHRRTDSPLESDRSTRLRSETAGQNPSPPLPEMRGHPKAGFQYVDIPPTPLLRGQDRSGARGNNEQRAPEKRAAEAQKFTAAQKEKPLSDSLDQDPANRLLEKIAKEEGDPFLAPATPIQRTQETRPDAQKVAEDKTTASSQKRLFLPSSGPSGLPQSAAQRPQYRREMVGGKTAEVGPASPEATESELGRYKAKMYRAIASAWYWLVDQNISLLALGSVRIKFYVAADGSVRDVSVILESGETAVLRSISLQSIRKAFPMEPFSESLRTQVGDGFWEECGFTIY